MLGSLPIYLARMGHDVRIVIPKYSFINFKNYELKKEIPILAVWMGNKEEWASVYSTEVKGVKIYFVEFNLYFDRNGIYHDSAFNDYEDNPKKIFFLMQSSSRNL